MKKEKMTLGKLYSLFSMQYANGDMSEKEFERVEKNIFSAARKKSNGGLCQK